MFHLEHYFQYLKFQQFPPVEQVYYRKLQALFALVTLGLHIKTLQLLLTQIQVETMDLLVLILIILMLQTAQTYKLQLQRYMSF